MHLFTDLLVVFMHIVCEEIVNLCPRFLHQDDSARIASTMRDKLARLKSLQQQSSNQTSSSSRDRSRQRSRSPDRIASLDDSRRTSGGGKKNVVVTKPMAAAAQGNKGGGGAAGKTTPFTSRFDKLKTKETKDSRARCGDSSKSGGKSKTDQLRRDSDHNKRGSGAVKAAGDRRAAAANGDSSKPWSSKTTSGGSSRGRGDTKEPLKKTDARRDTAAKPTGRGGGRDVSGSAMTGDKRRTADNAKLAAGRVSRFDQPQRKETTSRFTDVDHRRPPSCGSERRPLEAVELQDDLWRLIVARQRRHQGTIKED